MDGSVLLKTDNIGMVPCKTPASLIEIVPSVLTVDRYPTSISGVVSSNALFNILATGIDTSTLCPVTPSHLPVELISFTASALDNNSIELTWQTASETNNDYFVLEKSNDGRLFSKIVQVQGNGNSSRVNDYSFTDSDIPDLKILYYRLRQIDYDGSEHYSKIIPAFLATEDFKLIKTYSDEQTQSLNFYMRCNSPGNIEFLVTDILGKIKFRGTQTAEKDMNHIQLDTKHLSRGIYFYTITLNNQIISGKTAF